MNKVDIRSIHLHKISFAKTITIVGGDIGFKLYDILVNDQLFIKILNRDVCKMSI